MKAVPLKMIVLYDESVAFVDHNLTAEGARLRMKELRSAKQPAFEIEQTTVHRADDPAACAACYKESKQVIGKIHRRIQEL